MPSQYVGGRPAGSPVQARYLNINNASADTELVAAVPGCKIVVYALSLTCDAAAATKASLVSDGSSDTEIASHNFSTFATAPYEWLLPYSPAGWCETLSGEALDLRQTTTDDMDGVLVYGIVDGDGA